MSDPLKSTNAADEAIEISVVIPCLNEADTLQDCLDKAQRGLSTAKVSGEIVVADNGCASSKLRKRGKR